MTDENIRTSLDPDGILVATIDMPGRSMNVFSKSLIDSLDALARHVGNAPNVTGCVITSGKPSFLAGADLEMIKRFTETARLSGREALHALCGELGLLFRRLETSAKPFVAALNGLALGGGLELALACHARVVADVAEIQLGLPEVKLGLLPGAGGTQRLPRLVPVATAVRMLLTGEPVSAAKAKELGLVDAAVPAGELLSQAKRFAAEIAGKRPPWDRPGAKFSETPFDFSAPDADASVLASAGISAYQEERYPAHRAIARCVVGGWNQPMDRAIGWEMDQFVDLIQDPVAGNMVRTLFLNRQRAAKAGLLAKDGTLSQGEQALLPRLKQLREKGTAAGLTEDELNLAVSLGALDCWSANHAGIDPDLADVAVVSSGVMPAYTGGPLNYLRQLGVARVTHQAEQLRAQQGDLFRVPAGLAAFCAQADAAPP